MAEAQASAARAKGPKILAAWVERLERARMAFSGREALAAELGGWIDLMMEAVEGREWAEQELYRLVALHGRTLGTDGHPASSAWMRAGALAEALAAAELEEPRLQRIARAMAPILVDAFALGLAERLESRHLRELRDMSPVVRLGDWGVLGFLLGPMHAELLDPMLGRLARECARTGAKTAILDVFGAAPDDEMFRRTIRDFLALKNTSQIRLVLAGLRSPEEFAKRLEAMGVDPRRFEIVPDLDSLLRQPVASVGAEGSTIGRPAGPTQHQEER